MLVGIVAFGLYSYATQAKPSQSAYFESDASGRLKPVDRMTQATQPTVPLWKPEPSFLLEHSKQLSISKGQAERIALLHATWTRAKKDLLGQIQSATSRLKLDGSTRISIANSRDDLSEYSNLSREFQSRRDSAWQESIAVLDDVQCKTLVRIANATEAK
jgi:hypothetical protein